MRSVLNENSLVVDGEVEEETSAKREPKKACQGRKKKREEETIEEKLEKPRLAVEKVRDEAVFRYPSRRVSVQ